ncbi:neprilysin-3 [Musca domestica]|uniref:Endothelin-converting enzyme 1 n=1 Tax=Musca domestica TaxID=7370 RepID=A0A1I8NCB7_MUSDO|nr:neprilysin-3 [Musca domestica]
MKYRILNQLTFFIYVLFATTGHADRVSLIKCGKLPACVENINVETIQVMEEHMYNNTDPCGDFWDHACGSWRESPYYDHVDTIGAMTNYYADRLIDLLETLEKSHGELRDISGMTRKIWQYYESCRTSGEYFLKMSKYLKEFKMKDIFGNNFKWGDLIDGVSDGGWHNFDWLQPLAYLRQFGLNGVFFKESVNLAANDSSVPVVELKIPNGEKQFRNKYEIYEIFEEFEFNRAFAPNELWKLTDSVYGLQRELLAFYKIYENTNNEMSSLTLQQLNRAEPSLNWQLYFDRLAGKPLDPKTLILEVPSNLEYFQDLRNFLKQKDSSTIAWYILVSFLKHLFSVKPLISPRHCLLHTNVMFPLGVNYIYDRFLYENRQQDERVLQEILAQLKQQFSLYLQENKFQLSPTELRYLEEKLNAVSLKIGNLPQHIPDLNDYHSGLQLSRDNFYYNHLQLLKFRFYQQHKAALQENPSHIPLPHLYYVNDDIAALRNAPYFNHPRNELVIPMVFLQLPFYHHRQHPLLQHSILGWIMAHELSHAFDPRGLKYDHHGNSNPMGQQIAQNPLFIDSLECLTDNNSPTVSLNERLADVNGLQLIWDVYSPKIDKEKKLSSTFTNPQLFFLNFAQFFCGSLPPSHAHDLDNVRVRETVQHIADFKRIFKCKTKRDEGERGECRIWKR